MKKAVALALALVLILALLPGCGSRKLEASQRAQILLEAAAFSRSGLIDKLVSEGFTRRDAEKGVDSLDVDWFRVAAMINRSMESVTGAMERVMARPTVSARRSTRESFITASIWIWV